MEISSHSARSHWLLRGHMTSNDQTVSRQKALSARMLTDDRRYSLARFDESPPSKFPAL